MQPDEEFALEEFNMKDYLDDNAVEYQSLVDDCLQFEHQHHPDPGSGCLSPEQQELPLGDLSDGGLSSQQHRTYAPKGQIYEIIEASQEQSNSCLSSHSNNPKLSEYAASPLKCKTISITIHSSKSNESRQRSTHSNDTMIQDFEEGEVHSVHQGTSHENENVFDYSLITPKVRSRIISPNKVDSILNNNLLMVSGQHRSSLPAEPLGRRSQFYTEGYE